MVELSDWELVIGLGGLGASWLTILFGVFKYIMKRVDDMNAAMIEDIKDIDKKSSDRNSDCHKRLDAEIPLMMRRDEAEIHFERIEKLVTSQTGTFQNLINNQTARIDQMITLIAGLKRGSLAD
jgi:hypothetical protein